MRGAPTTTDRASATLLTISNAAIRLCCSEKTVHRRIAKGDLIAFKVGRLVRISEHELANYLNRSRMSM